MVIQARGIGGGARSASATRGAWYLIYDGECGFCARWVALLKAGDRKSRLRFVPFQDAAALVELPYIPLTALEQAMHLVAPSNAIFAGAAAVPPILRLLPGGWLVAWIFRLPGVPGLAARGYRVVARNRHRLGCGSKTCHLGGPS